MTSQWKRRAIKLVLSVVGLGVSAAVLYGSYLLAGLLATIVYAVLFLVGVLGVPTFILFKGTDFVGGTTLGKLHFLLGQFAFGSGVLLQRGDTHEMVPGRKTTDGYDAYVDGQWQAVTDTHNVSILGLRPFLYVTAKDTRGFEQLRVDPAAEAATQTDGGETVTRAGVSEVPPPAEVSGLDGTMIVDLKRLFESGLRKMGNISLIEKAEEIEQRNQSQESMSDKYSTVIGSIVGLIIGVISGYLMLVGL
jgi:hypothetical protein